VVRRDSAPAHRTRPILPVVFVALGLAIAVLAYVAHARARDGYLSEKGSELRAIADLKVSQIVAWRAERLADARVVSADPLLAAAVRDWLADSARAEPGASLQARLGSLRDEYGYERVSLLDAHGGLRLTAPPGEPRAVATGEMAREALATSGVSFLDLHGPETGQGIHLDLVAPLRPPGDPGSRPVAFVVFRSDPHRFLYPLVQSWPTPSRTGETLLVRREGSEVLYLNQLRHRSGTALTLRLPVAQPELPSGMAVQGREGVVQGIDYRGQRVLAALRQVPDSPWFLVSKVDRAELVAPLARDAWLTALLAAAMIALAGLGAVCFWWRERELSDAELRESESRHRALFDHSLSGVALHEIVTDDQGRATDYVFLEVNAAFEKLTGLRREDIVGRRVTQVLPGIEKDPFIETYGRVVATGEGTRFEQFATPLGRHYEGAAFPLGGKLFAAVFNDVTERKHAEGRLRLQGAALEAAANAVMITDRDGRIEWANEAFSRLTGWSLEACQGKTPRILKSGHHDQRFYEDLWRTILGGTVWQREMVNRRKDGAVYIEDQTITPVTDERGETTHFVAIKIDVTERKRAEDALRESERRYRSLFEGMLNGFAYCRMLFDQERPQDFVYLEVNPAFESSTGLRDVVGKRVTEVIPGIRDADPELFESLGRVSRTGKPETFEIYVAALKTWFRIGAYSPEPEHFVALFDVITERKRAEEGLKLFRTLVDRSNDALEVLDPDTGRFLDVSEKSCQDLGYSHDELLAMSVFDIDPVLDQASFARSRDRLQQSGRVSWEGVHRRKDGSTFPVEVGLTLVQLDRGYIVAVARDITERRRAEAALRESEQRYRSLFEGMLHGFAYCRMLFENGRPQDFVYLEVNRAFETLTGLEGVVGRRVTEVIPGIRESNPELFEIYGRVALTGQPERFETYVDPLRIWFAISVYSPEREHFVAVFDNITERKRIEAQLRQAQKMEAIGQLAGGVAHDFNNLLGVIGGHSEMVLRSLPADDPQRKRIEGIRKAGERAADLTRQLLTFGRKQAIAPVVLDLSQVVSGLEGMLRRLIPEHIQIVTAFDSGAATVKADPGQVEQVILNLAVNARDAMPDGGRLTIETSLAELDEAYCRSHAAGQPGHYVLLAVSDTGTGMDDETQAHIFEPFFTTKQVGKGTGLGLATVYGVVKQHDGYVWVYSELGRGTTFKVYLPRVDDAVSSAEQPAPRLEAQPVSETILLVEDDEALRELNREILEVLGYRVLEAADGEAALEENARHQGPLHLLLTDMVMPGMTGRQLAERLRLSRPGIRVLVISGYTNDVVVRGGDLDVGMAFLQKPFTPDALGRKIREVLGAPA